MTKFDIVVTTYNRKEMICDFVSQILACKQLPERIIIVDSSDEENIDVSRMDRVLYVRSSHKNQPYQRYLGLQFVREEIVTFFDDDLKIIDKDIFAILMSKFDDNTVIGSAVRFEFEGINPVQIKMGASGLNKSNAIVKIIWWFTGAPHISSGKMWLAGLRGDNNSAYVESFSGACMAFRKESILEAFTNILFSLFETKRGMGEDKFISMWINRKGLLAYDDRVCLLHPSEESNYFQNVYSFTRKELYSRLWLSKRYAEVNGLSMWIVYLHFYWYAMWRILIGSANFLLRPRCGKWDVLRGRCQAVWDTLTIPMKNEVICKGINWENEITKDVGRVIVYES